MKSLDVIGEVFNGITILEKLPSGGKALWTEIYYSIVSMQVWEGVKKQIIPDNKR